MNEIQSEESAIYHTGREWAGYTAEERATIDDALVILDKKIKTVNAISSPAATRDYLRLHLAGEQSEVFCVLFLDSKHRPIVFKKIFNGTIDACTIYPRDIVRAAIKYNCKAVILAHNHPSGVPEPSRSDEEITQKLKSALALIDVKIIDHMVIGDNIVSFAERGLL